MSETELTDHIGQLLAGINRLTETIQEGKAKPADGGREAAAVEGRAEIATQLSALTQEQFEKRVSAEVKAQLEAIRTPSLATALGQGASVPQGSRMLISGQGDPHPALKAMFRDYRAGELLDGIADYKNMGGGGVDIARIEAGRKALEDLGVQWAGVPSASKATLGTTGATGGYVLANNLVDSVIKPETQIAVYQNLVTVRNGVNVRGVDQPYRTGAPARMTFQNWGATKDNVDEAYGSYTAYLGTMARIYDLGKQYVRFSQGSAEADVIDELTRAAILGENYYILAGQGSGISTPGVNDPTVGVYTALINTTPTYTTAHSASASTVAGSAANGLISGFAALATRSRRATAGVMDAVTYWTLYGQGSDSAGFWMSELLGAGFQITPDGALRWRGVPLYFDANFNTNTGTTKAAIVGDWPTARLLRGMEFRIDTSDTAGDRWDKNLVGFRGEEEIGFNANSAVAVGAFQLITGLIP